LVSDCRTADEGNKEQHRYANKVQSDFDDRTSRGRILSHHYQVSSVLKRKIDAACIHTKVT